jgi:hypothetical protein
MEERMTAKTVSIPIIIPERMATQPCPHCGKGLDIRVPATTVDLRLSSSSGEIVVNDKRRTTAGT